MNPELRIFTTCPPSAMADRSTCLERLGEIARWSERAGCEGMLIFADNRQLDPWVVSLAVLDATETLSPLIAIQPAYMHPFTVAKLIASIAFVHDRRLHLNMVAGGFRNDLIALNDPTPHDERYARLVEYTHIIRTLLESEEALSFAGRYYEVSNLKLAPGLPPGLLPDVLVSGSSEAGMNAARRLGATPVEYPKPPGEYADRIGSASGGSGIRIGITARDSDEQAWRDAYRRFPEDRKGQLTRGMATKASDSEWHKQLADSKDRDIYWLGPFRNYKTMCPYLVGSYDRVSRELRCYIDAGFSTFILDVPEDEADLQHAREAFGRAMRERAAA